MALKNVVHLYVDEQGRFLADLDDGQRIIVTEIRSAGGKPRGRNYQNHQGATIPLYMLKTTDYLTMAMTRGALRLLATQNSDGGWPWMNPDTDPSQGMPSPANTLGVTAQGLLDCHDKVPQEKLLDACRLTYDYMVEKSIDPDPAKHRIRGPDIPFLVELSERVSSPIYAAFAKERWASAVTEFGGGTATGFAQFIRDARKGQNLPALISWDINLYIQGVLALNRFFPGEGILAQACEMAEVIHDSLYVAPVDFDITDDTQAEFWCGIIGALEAFNTACVHRIEVVDLVSQLLGGQQSDGHFIGVNGGSDDQTTAYAALVLMKAGQDRAVLNAINYLVSSQLANGGWNYDGGENTEVTSEAAQAIHDYI